MIDAIRAPGFLALALLAVLTSKTQAADDCDPKVGRVASYQGRVEVQRGTAGSWQPIGLDEALCQGDAVRAGPRSRASLALNNDAILRLDQNSTLHLQNVVGDPEERSLLELLRGAIQSFSRKPRLIQVNTPYLNGTIEGTEFALRVGDDRTELTVLEGTVRAANPKGELSVAAGQSAVALAGKAPQPRTVVDPRDAVQWSLYYPPILATSGTAKSIAGTDIAEAADLLSVGQVAEAGAAIDRALAADPNSGQAYALRAVIGVVQNRRDQALADAEKAVSLDDSTASRIALSYVLQSSFRLQEARDVLRNATADDPASALAWARLAELELMLGDRRASMSAATRATEIAPDLSRTQLVNGFAALARFRTDDATAAFAKAIEADPADPLGHLGKGLAKIGGDDLTGGRKDLEVAVSLDSNKSLYRSYLGKAYYEEKRGPLDAEQLEIAKQLDPLDPTPYLYDGIRRQTVNDPVGALSDIQASIERNDNRAVFRSRLLLDKDRAARATSLARVYDDLGFENLGVNQAALSLSVDPANASAHRFLSGSYRYIRRRETARLSELLQAQLMQDVNLNPIQPSISSSNLNIVSLGGAFSPGFNEFTSLFEQNKSQLDVSAFGGNNDTYGGEIVGSAIHDRLSLSGGAFSYDTDGYRKNNDLSHEIYDVFAQYAVSPAVNLQGEVAYRKTKHGDLAQEFDPDVFNPTFRRTFEETIGRVGARFTPSVSSNLLLSAIFGDITEDQDFTLDFGDGVTLDNSTRSDVNTQQYEAQYLYSAASFDAIVGGAYSNADLDTRVRETFRVAPDPPFFPGFEDQDDSHRKNTIDDWRGYLYTNWDLFENLVLTAGASYQDYQEDTFQFDRFNPKIGLQWDVDSNVRVRAAYFHVVKPALVTNRTIEPTQVAGFNQFFDDANGTKSKRYGVGFDWDARNGLTIGAEATWRDLDEPVTTTDRGVRTTKFEDRDERFHRVYAHWTPAERWALSAEAVYDKYESEKTRIPVPRKATTVSVPLQAMYFHPSGFFAGGGVTYVDQEVRRFDNSELPEGDSTFTLVDIAAGYRLPKRWGTVSFSVKNLFDKKFDYLDDSYREFQGEPSVGPYIPDRTILATVNLAF